MISRIAALGLCVYVSASLSRLREPFRTGRKLRRWRRPRELTGAGISGAGVSHRGRRDFCFDVLGRGRRARA